MSLCAVRGLFATDKEMARRRSRSCVEEAPAGTFQKLAETRFHSSQMIFYTQPFLIMHSAICSVFRAAPLRIWSPTTQKLKVLGLEKSRRRRPT